MSSAVVRVSSFGAVVGSSREVRAGDPPHLGFNVVFFAAFRLQYASGVGMSEPVLALARVHWTEESL